MRKSLFFYILILVGMSCVVGVLIASEWEEKPYTEWSREATIAMLTHSPWATREVIAEEAVVEPSSPGGAVDTETRSDGGSSASTEADPAAGGVREARTYSITFMSARPIRMALARWALLTGNVTRAKAEQFLAYDPFGDSIVIAIAVPPGQDVSELESLKAEDLQDTTFLHLEKSSRKLNLVRYVPPSQSGNNGGLFFFPGSENGQPTVTVEEEEIRFETKISDFTAIDEEFRLDQMIFKGELEL